MRQTRGRKAPPPPSRNSQHARSNANPSCPTRSNSLLRPPPLHLNVSQHLLLLNRNAFHLLHPLPLEERHQPARAGHDARQRDEETRTPARPVDAIVPPHESRQHGLQKRVQHVRPDDEVELPQRRRGRAHAGQRRIRSGGGRDREGGVRLGRVDGIVVVVRAADGTTVATKDVKPIAARQAKPGAVKSGEAAEGVGPVEGAEAQQVVGVAEAPGDEAEAGDAEESVEDLRVDLDPDAAGGVDGVAGWVAHGRRGVDEEQEEHAAPGDDVQAVDHHEEAERGQEEFPEGFEPDDGGFAPGFLGGWVVAVGVVAVFVGDDWFGVGGWGGGGADAGGCGCYWCIFIWGFDCSIGGIGG